MLMVDMWAVVFYTPATLTSIMLAQHMQDVAKRPQGPPNQTPSNVGGWFGIAELGAFSKVRECVQGVRVLL
jgi:hypothetical protein